LARIFGIPVGINYTWLIVFVLVTLSLATGYFPTRYAEWGLPTYVTIGLLTSVLFFGSVVVHELAHSVVAMAWGIPVKGITLFIFGGVANIGREPERPLAEFLIAVAGPIASLLLAMGFGLAWLAGQWLDFTPLAGLGLYLATVNLWLALFNLIPGFPLDGGRVFRSLVWAWSGDMDRATQWASTTGRVVAMMMIIGGGVLFLTGNWSSGLWLAFIGWFLDTAARQSAQQAWIRQSLRGYTAGDFSSSCRTIDSNTPLDWLVRDHVLPSGESCFVVTDSNQVQGVVTVNQIRKVPHEKRGWIPVHQIMTPLRDLEAVKPGESAYSVLEKMLSDKQSLLPVMDGSRFVGFVRQENLLRFAQTRKSLGV
jgi:Zn-dependent protease